ncbi:MAG: YcgN family cysteine cluster protein [Gammaproteobacteria bacterium]|nr:YcgN family cysteine cluster protein [Gammaproteobacteria bacterium]
MKWSKLTDQTPPNAATLPLDQLNDEQWESLCDGCGRCCMSRFQDELTDDIFQTCIACNLYDRHTGLCRDYENRQYWVPDCWKITKDNIAQIAHWMPLTCAYRLRFEGKSLPQWHPLVSQNQDDKFLSGLMMRSQCVSEKEAEINGWEQYLVSIEHNVKL